VRIFTCWIPFSFKILLPLQVALPKVWMTVLVLWPRPNAINIWVGTLLLDLNEVPRHTLEKPKIKTGTLSPYSWLSSISCRTSPIKDFFHVSLSIFIFGNFTPIPFPVIVITIIFFWRFSKYFWTAEAFSKTLLAAATLGHEQSITNIPLELIGSDNASSYNSMTFPFEYGMSS